MAVYTTELRTFFDQFSHYKGNPPLFPSHSEKIEMGREKLFNFDYPVFDENYRKVFETNFIRKFYMREIGFETFGLFQFQLETWLLINMPYWNKMLESELLQYDPLTNAEMSVSHSKKTDKTQNDVRDTLNTTTTTGVNEATSNRVGTVDKTDTSSSTQNGTSSSSGTNDVVSNSEITATSNTEQENTSSGTTSENGSVTDDNFNRELDSNNPDSRLSISATDGEGIIEYASSIKENNENNSKETSKSGESNSTSNTTGSQTSNAVDSGTTSQTSTDENTSSITSGVTAQSNSDTTDSVTDHAETNVTGSGNRNDKLTSSVNDVEDFIQHRIGKIGVQSYPKMVKEYRESLLRIEKQIFDEMNELFMLVY